MKETKTRLEPTLEEATRRWFIEGEFYEKFDPIMDKYRVLAEKFRRNPDTALEGYVRIALEKKSHQKKDDPVFVKDIAAYVLETFEMDARGLYVQIIFDNTETNKAIAFKKATHPFASFLEEMRTEPEPGSYKSRSVAVSPHLISLVDQYLASLNGLQPDISAASGQLTPRADG